MVEGPLVEAGPGLDERRRARDGGDRQDGRRRADEDAAPPRAKRSVRSTVFRTAVRSPDSVALTGARAPLAARMTTSRSTVRGSRCSRIGARKAWKRTPQSASGM